MKILKCPQCGTSLVVATYACYLGLKCTQCRYTDYMYAFTANNHLYQEKRPGNGLLELLPVFKEGANALINYSFNLSGLIADYAHKYDLPQRVVATIINIYLNGENKVADPIKEKYFFAEYVAEKISMDDLYERLSSIEKNYQEMPDTLATPGNLEMENRNLKSQVSKLENELERKREECIKFRRFSSFYKEENLKLRRDLEYWKKRKKEGEG